MDNKTTEQPPIKIPYFEKLKQHAPEMIQLLRRLDDQDPENFLVDVKLAKDLRDFIRMIDSVSK